MCTSSGGDQRFLYHQFIGSPSQLWWKWQVTVLTIMTDLTGFTHSLAPWWWSFSSRLQSVWCVMIVKHSSLFFIYQVDKWERTLSLILEVTEMILTVQRQWMYLEVCYLQLTVLSVNVLSSFSSFRKKSKHIKLIGWLQVLSLLSTIVSWLKWLVDAGPYWNNNNNDLLMTFLRSNSTFIKTI